MKVRKRRRLFALILPILLFFAACDTGEGMDPRLFCERYSETASLPRLEPGRLQARPSGAGRQYEAYITETMLLTLATGPDGVVHTVSLTALPETASPDFRYAAADVIKTYCGLTDDAAARWLDTVHAGESEILGYASNEENGFRLTYAANAAGRFVRVSQLRFLPEEPPLPTLKEIIRDERDSDGE